MNAQKPIYRVAPKFLHENAEQFGKYYIGSNEYRKNAIKRKRGQIK